MTALNYLFQVQVDQELLNFFYQRTHLACHGCAAETAKTRANAHVHAHPPSVVINFTTSYICLQNPFI